MGKALNIPIAGRPSRWPFYNRFRFIGQGPGGTLHAREGSKRGLSIGSVDFSAFQVASLAALAPQELLLDTLKGFALAQGPGGSYEFVGMRIAGDPMDDRLGRKTFDDVAYQRDVSLLTQTFETFLAVQLFKRRPPNNVEQMKFDALDGQTGQEAGRGQHVVAGLPREA